VSHGPFPEGSVLFFESGELDAGVLVDIPQIAQSGLALRRLADFPEYFGALLAEGVRQPFARYDATRLF